MEHDYNIYSFIITIFFFIVFMYILVLSSNLSLLFLGWEGVGIISYLLINNWYNSYNNTLCATKAIIYNRIGDILLMISITLPYNNNILIYIAALFKSAQFISINWLTDAMAGPTPVSALLHAATMVTAGIYLIIKYSTYTNIIIPIITIIYSGYLGYISNDIKKVIAYSTCSQLGYMYLGLPYYSLFHIIIHGYFKALLFMIAGIFIHLYPIQDLRRFPNINNNYLYILLLYAILALIGFPYISGYYSKDLIIESYISSIYYYILLLIGNIFTCLYSIKIIHLLFLSSNNPNYLNSINHFFKSIISFFYIFLVLFLGYFYNDIYSTSNDLHYYIILKYITILPIVISIFIYINSNNYIYNYRILNLNLVYNSIAYLFLQFSYYIYRYIDKGILEYLGPIKLYRFLYK